MLLKKKKKKEHLPAEHEFDLLIILNGYTVYKMIIPKLNCLINI